MKSTNEKFIIVFEDVIIPIMDEMMVEDYIAVKDGNNEFCQSEAEFIRFRGAFEQRIKLFYFRKFIKYKREGKEHVFPGDIENIERDMKFLYVEFKSFLKEQRIKIGER